MRFLTATVNCSSLPANRVVSWLDLVKEEDPTFAQPATDEEAVEDDSGAGSERETSRYPTFSQPDQVEPSATDDEEGEGGGGEESDSELEALKKRFEKYLTRKERFIDVGSYDIADPFIDDTMEALELDGAEPEQPGMSLDSLKFCVVGWNAATNAPNVPWEPCAEKRGRAPEKAPKDKKPKKPKLSQPDAEPESQVLPQEENVPQAATSKTKNIDYELDIAVVEFHRAQEAFMQAAGQKSITDKTKFPASLQLPLWNFVRWQILSNPQHSFEDEQLASLVSKTLPFSPGSVRKLLFKVIVPEMLEKISQESKAAFDALKQSLLSKNAAQREQTDNPMQEPNDASQEADKAAGAKKGGIQVDDNERRLLYEYLKGEFDIFTLRGAFSKYEEPTATLASEYSYRRGFYIKMQSELNDILSSSTISFQFTSYKRKLWRKVCKQL